MNNHRDHHRSTPKLFWLGMSSALPLLVAPSVSFAQAPSTQVEWNQCSQFKDDNNARLACYDQWAAQQPLLGATNTTAEASSWHGQPALTSASSSGAYVLRNAPAHDGMSSVDRANMAADAGEKVVVANNDGCRNPAFDATSRFWELNNDTDCGNFRFRGYRPAIIAVARANRVNETPYSPTRGRAEYQDYQKTEMRFQISVRTKVLSNLLTSDSSSKRDSLWFGYTQQSYWQLFNASLSRPFRDTDYEPELIYIYPVEWNIFGTGAKLRYAGMGINHQSNGQSNPISRSWNRYFITAGVDITPHLRMSGRLWKRMSESGHKDDNPNIGNYIGLAELTTYWSVTPRDTVTYTFKRSLKSQARGSNRVEWFHALGQGFAGGKSNLNLYAGVFSGYGDSLLDYNYRRTVFNVGFSLVDF